MLFIATSAGEVRIALPKIEPAVDAAFTAFYQQLESGVAPDAAAFDAVVLPFLLNSKDAGAHDKYFNCFTPLWLHHQRNRDPKAAIAVWPWALRPVLAAEKQSGHLIHKGTPYYFWGMTVLLQENLEEGYLLMHRALEEDVRTHGTAAPNTPGWALATLDYHKQEQAFLPWVQKQAAHVEERLSTYRSSHGRSLTLPVLRTRFLARPAYRDAVQQFCYSLARSLWLRSLSDELWEGPFPAQVAFNAIFDLCLVVDSALHEKNPAQWQFIDHATFLSQSVGLGLSNDDLKEVNGQFKASFATALGASLSGTLTLKSGTPITGLAAALALTYGCRNRGAHSVASVPISAHDFDAIIQRICETLFVAIEDLYT